MLTAILTVAAIALAVYAVPKKRKGSLLFWRVGRVGGSFYIAKRKGE